MLGIVRVKMLKGEKGDTGASGDYSTLTNKPSIGGVELNGNKTASDLGLGSLSEQQNLLEAVTALNESVNNVEDDITDINGDITDINTAIAGIRDDIAEKSGTFTPNEGITVINEQIKQVGNVVYVRLILGKSGSGSISPLGTISGVDTPSTNEILIGDVAYPTPQLNNYAYGSLSVQSDGTITKASNFPETETYTIHAKGFYFVG